VKNPICGYYFYYLLGFFFFVWREIQKVVPFIERIVYSATSFAKREFLFSRSRAGTSYSATIPAKKDAHAHANTHTHTRALPKSYEFI
jgi:hypothetical protein